jgi:hypothetical protein
MNDFAPTKPARWILDRAEQLGLRPKLDPTAYRGSWRVTFSGTGEWSGFGGLYIGARTGRILRASLTFGNDGPTRRYKGHYGAHTLLRDYTTWLSRESGTSRAQG